jgi:hypothetical protein
MFDTLIQNQGHENLPVSNLQVSPETSGRIAHEFLALANHARVVVAHLQVSLTPG